jgi:hypothetical protein
MIVTQLKGGLGNQMFQYAFGRQLAVLRNTELFLDTSDLSKGAPYGKLELALGIFNITVPIAGPDVLNKFETIRKSSVKSRLQHILPSMFPYHIVHQGASAFNKKFLSAPENSLLIGYWQSEKYFETIQNNIRRDFTFKPLSKEADIALSTKISSCNSVSMHFRRGDYISNPEALKYHGTCSAEYYQSALKYIKEKVNEVEIFIFSDDIEWVKQNISFGTDKVTFIENHSGAESYIDMQLMSLCKHNIIANSSFSWWGAWLNNNPDKLVVAPKKWFTDSKIDTSDLIPQGWKRI